MDTDDWKNTPSSFVRHVNSSIPRLSQSETAPTAIYDNESRSEKTAWKREGYQQLVGKLMDKRNRVEVFSRTWSAWFPCVVRPHSHTNYTVVVYYHNGTDTIVKLLDPESTLIRTVQGPIYSIYCHSIKEMYSILCQRIKVALQFYDVKIGGMFSSKEHSCFTGRDLMMWLRAIHHGEHEEDIMVQLGNELLSRGIIWRVKPAYSLDVVVLSSVKTDSNAEILNSDQKDSQGTAPKFVPRADYMYALNELSVIGKLNEKENMVVKEQEDRLYWTTKSRLGVFCSSSQKWEFGTVVSTLDPWLLVVYGKEPHALKYKWVHRLDVERVRHPRRFWRNGSQIWVFSRGDKLWYSGLVSKRETRFLGDQQVPIDESTLNVTYGPTDSQGAFTRTKQLKLCSEHIRPRVTRLSRMCIRIKTKDKPLQNVDEIKNRLAAFCKYTDGQRPYYDAQPDVSSLIMVCRKVEMTVRVRERESRILSEAHKFDVTVEVIPWEVFTAGRDVLYNHLKPTTI